MSNTVSIKIDNRRVERFPLLLKYEGQFMPQPCGFELSLETGELTAFVSGEIGNGVPESVWNNRVIRLKTSPYLFHKELIGLAEEHKDLFNRILAGSDVVWNGSNWVGKMTEDANEAILDWEYGGFGHPNLDRQMWPLDVPEMVGELAELEWPENQKELDEIVENFISLDGDVGWFEREMTKEEIEKEVIETLLKNDLFNQRTAAFMLKMARELEIDDDDYDRERLIEFIS